MSAKRTLFGYLLGMIIGLFGVFIFSNFEYQGIIMQDFFVNSNENWFYEFIWMSFRFNFYLLFDLSSVSNSTLLNDFFPPFMGWITAGFISASIIKGYRRSLLNSFVMLFTIGIIWLIVAIVVGANMTFIFLINIVGTSGGVMNAFIGSIIGSLIGATLTSKPKTNKHQLEEGEKDGEEE